MTPNPPHIELLLASYDIILYEIGRYIKPRPDFHKVNERECWVWTGSMSTSTPISAGKTQKKITNSGTISYIRQKNSYPCMRLGQLRLISISRLLYIIYRKPILPVTRLNRFRCVNHKCVNPYHFQAVQKDVHGDGPAGWVEDSPLWFIPGYLSGADAQDSASRIRRETKRLDTEQDLMERLKKTNVIMLIEDFEKIKNDAEIKAAAIVTTGVESTPKPVRELNRHQRKWQMDAMGNHVYNLEFCNAEAEYITYLAKWLKGRALSPELSEKLKYFSVEIPILKHGDLANYWIGTSDIADTEGLVERAYRAGCKTGSSVCDFIEKDETHIRLVLLGINNERKLIVADIDWSK